METWVWIALALIAVVIIAIAVGTVVARNKRTEALREQFGREYDRALTEEGGRREGESLLKDRVKRYEALQIRPLSPSAGERYQTEWRDVQARFVDTPEAAVRDADELIIRVMRDRGYPMDDFEQRSADISVDHADVVDDYRAGHAISLANDNGKASTEDLRQAMVHYRSLFDRMVEVEDRTRSQEAQR